MKNRVFVLSILILVFVGFCSALFGQESKEDKALEAAKVWLKLIDNGEYEKSWQTAAEYLKNVTTKEQFKQSLIAGRSPLGSVISRTLKSKEYIAGLPGAPDGEYVEIQFQTSFENKHSSIETIASMLDVDGEWRVAGYYIK